MTPGPGPSEDQKKRSVTDFVFGKVIGEGSFSTVFLAKDVTSNKEVAIKVLEKQHIKKEKKIQYVAREKDCLLRLNGTGGFFVKLYCTFQDADRLYFCMSYAKNGELLKYISEGVLNMECTRYYAAELVVALEVLRSKGIIHRDFKPENILLDENWHILITDFGCAKLLTDDDAQNENIVNVEDLDRPKRKTSFVGTAQYVSPEMLTYSYATYASDLWAFGCILYQMIAGTSPFKGRNDYLTFQKIVKVEYEFPADFDPVGCDLVRQLLVEKEAERLGAQDTVPYHSLREHAFFEGVLDWENLGTPPKMDKTLEDPQDTTELLANLEPGLDEEKVSRLHLDHLICTTTSTNDTPPSPPTTAPISTTPPTPSITPNVRKKSQAMRNIITDITPEEIAQRTEIQQTNDPYHGFVEGNLILKQGFIDKRKGLFARKRMFLLTLGPHLYYVDPVAMVLKGEIPWSGELRAEAKNFKIFFVHTPNRTYYLEDQDGYALEWCKCIDEVKSYYFPPSSS